MIRVKFLDTIRHDDIMPPKFLTEEHAEEWIKLRANHAWRKTTDYAVMDTDLPTNEHYIINIVSWSWLPKDWEIRDGYTVPKNYTPPFNEYGEVAP